MCLADARAGEEVRGSREKGVWVGEESTYCSRTALQTVFTVIVREMSHLR